MKNHKSTGSPRFEQLFLFKKDPVQIENSQYQEFTEEILNILQLNSLF